MRSLSPSGGSLPAAFMKGFEKAKTPVGVGFLWFLKAQPVARQGSQVALSSKVRLFRAKLPCGAKTKRRDDDGFSL